jgi:4-hydroxy-3-polyprenylbenzoate decarboxylase
MAMLPEIVDMHMPAEGVFHNLVLVKIEKTYPGHAHKVMNSLWGAGQMMFNKVMVVIDEDIDLTDYAAVMKCLVKHVQVRRDVAFSRGPVDVLDHASAAYAYGGKLGIDGTRKLPEELAAYPNLKEGNDRFQECIDIIPITKSRPAEVREMAEQLLAGATGITKQIILFVEGFLDATDYSSIVWRVFNNIDPARDCYFIRDALVVDGTRKFAGIDHFKRPWPNCTVSDLQTIQAVDGKWNMLGLGPLIASPSLKYQKQLYPGGAEAE